MSDNNYVFSTGYAQMRPFVDGYFLFSLIQSERFVKVVLDNCTGTSYPAINVNDLAKIEVAVPSGENEAHKIGTIFRSLDHLITLHQRKLGAINLTNAIVLFDNGYNPALACEFIILKGVLTYAKHHYQKRHVILRLL